MYRSAVHLEHSLERRRGHEEHKRRELGGAQDLQRVRLDVEDRHASRANDLPDGLELRAVQRALVRAVLEVLVRRDVRQHLRLVDEVVLRAVHFLRLFRSRCIYMPREAEDG